MQERKRFSYYAFISYKREDEKWAGWLQKQLETYRIPSIIRKQNLNVPKKIYPVFRDKTDLSGGKVLELLHKELEESQYLIVICSSHSAKSQWVNKEVHHFIELGREDYIIPFVVEGEGSDSFPETLKTEVQSEVLGISVPELGRHQAFLRVVATLLNLKFDQLMMRDRKRRKRKKMMTAAAALVCLVLLAGGIWYFMPHSAYYRSYVYVNEIPRGVDRLSGSQRSHISECYRLVTQRGKVIRVTRVNPAGKPVVSMSATFLDDAPEMEFYYEGDRVTRVEFKNETGQIVLSKDYSSNLKAVDFLQAEDSSQTMALAADQTSVMDSFTSTSIFDTKSEITRHINTYDEEGYLIRVQFMRDNLNTPARDSNGIYGRAYERDDKGRIIRMTYLDEEGVPQNSRLGVAGWVYEYDEEGKRTYSYAFDLEGNQVRGEDGFAAMELKYDENGNVTEAYYRDEEGELCIIDDGYAWEKMTYDDRGYLVENTYYDAEGNPAFEKENGVHGCQVEYDDEGFICRMVCLGSDGTIKNSSLGYADVRQVNDAMGRPVRVRYNDAKGEPACNVQTGEYGFNVVYDEQGNVTEVVNLDREEKPAADRNGYAYIKRQYNEGGQLIRESFEDAQGNPVRIRENYTSCEFSYDRKGNLQEQILRDEQGNLCRSSYGYARVLFQYDESGNLTETAYFDEENLPVISSDGYASYKSEYDAYGNCIRNSYYNTDGSLIKLPDGYALEEMEYDEYGNVIKYTYYDENGNPVQHKNLYHQLVKTYDSRGNCIQEEGYTADTYRMIQYTYDKNNLLIEQKYLNEDGSPAMDEEGVFAYRSQYDEQGRIIAMQMTDVFGRPVEASGYTGLKYQYDENNNLVHAVYYDGEEIQSQEIYSYDEKGNHILTAYQDGGGNPMMTRYGAFAEREYNDMGDVIRTSYFDTNKAPWIGAEGCASFINTVDNMGNITEVHYFGADGQPIVSSGGFASGIREYNAQGWKIRDSFYGLDGKLISNENGQASVVEYIYDDSGREKMEIYYDCLGQEVNRTSLLVQMINIQENSLAAQAGIQEGDFLIARNEWNIFAYEDMLEAVDVLGAISSDTSSEKEVVFARNTQENTFVFFRATVGPGPMGVRLVDMTCMQTDWEYVKQQYEAWLKEGEK